MNDMSAFGFCTSCNKKMYADRKTARKVARLHATHKYPYRCPVNEMFWHVGEMHHAVIKGVVDRTTYYKRQAS